MLENWGRYNNHLSTSQQKYTKTIILNMQITENKVLIAESLHFTILKVSCTCV